MHCLFLCLLLTVMAAPQPQVSQANQNDDGPTNFNLPPEVSLRFQKENFLAHYDVSNKLNPFYLRGDFDGDGIPDYAVLVLNRATKIVGIAMVRSRARYIEVLGAGGTKLRVAATEDGSPSYLLDGFDWMDAWHVERKQHLRFTGLDKPIKGMAAEGLLVERSEASSGLIYWDGKRYRWLQTSD
ncbi:MAG TPA: hypothetical protein VN176_06910 [Verrucomicrobiae bacterium]|jgi:hypothetical protein|nr:hypothetical protein [Verrucomicrobiae bacterium]